MLLNKVHVWLKLRKLWLAHGNSETYGDMADQMECHIVKTFFNNNRESWRNYLKRNFMKEMN